ncbi:MAG TPA: fructosamine kinase family protein [Saprospiraceae bacterium]|nr:fructosamine kinase family protein [Saprospiraceae bacterium]
MEELLSIVFKTIPFRWTSVSGGDICQAALIETSDQKLFAKYHPGAFAFDMLEKERFGLEALLQACPDSTPTVMGLFSSENIGALLVMDYLEPLPPTRNHYLNLASSLAYIHRKSTDQFGFAKDNYIGSLPQSNAWHDRFVDFFIEERLLPQILRACDQGRLSVEYIHLVELNGYVLNSIIPEESPSMVHGDLWKGNVIYSKLGKVYYIDPSVYFGHREVDIAMMKLFGGFHPMVYEYYDDQYPLSAGWQKRLEIYQLYYLLVHLNLFGSSYSQPVLSILNRYFR